MKCAKSIFELIDYFVREPRLNRKSSMIDATYSERGLAFELFQQLCRYQIETLFPSLITDYHSFLPSPPPFFRGSALAAATGGDPVLGKEAILALMEAVSI